MSSVTVIPLMGLSPHSHMGHRYDLGEKLATLPGPRLVGISGAPGILTLSERCSILEKQWAGINCLFFPTDSAGKTIAMANKLCQDAKLKTLNILVGADRKVKQGLGLKKSLEAGKIKEMEGQFWDEINVITPDDEERTHGLSGTRMRQAIIDDDFATYLQHYGKYDLNAESVYSLVLRPAAVSGELVVKRK